jgi:MFS family permease
MRQSEPSPLRHLVRLPLYWHWETATTILRLAGIMIPFAYIFISVDVTGGPGLGGALVAASMIAGEISGPFCGRLIDRLGVRTWGPILLVLGAAGQLIIALAFASNLSPWLFGVLVVILAAITSGSGGTTRTMLGRAVPERLLGPAFALDAVLVEVCVVTAPFLVTLFSLLNAVGALFVTSGLTVVSALLFLLLGRRPELDEHRTDEHPADEERPSSAADNRPTRLWRNRRFIFWMLVGLLFGYLIGTADLGALPLANMLGHDKLQASIMIGALAAASAFAGLTYAWASHWITISPNLQAAILLAGMGLSGIVISVSDSLVLTIVSYAALGLCVAPINAVRQKAIITEVPPKRTVEAFASIDSVYGLAYALSGIMVAVLAPRWLVGSGAGAALFGLLLAALLLSGRRRGNGGVPAPDVRAEVPAAKSVAATVTAPAAGTDVGGVPR